MIIEKFQVLAPSLFKIRGFHFIHYPVESIVYPPLSWAYMAARNWLNLIGSMLSHINGIHLSRKRRVGRYDSRKKEKKKNGKTEQMGRK
jgi:hypothetical protein